MSALRCIAAVARVETLLLLRSRTTFTLLILVPALQVLLFGYAIRPAGTPVGVVVAAPTVASADRIAEWLRRETGFTIVSSGLKPGAAAAAVHGGEALIGIEVPALRSFANPLQVQQPLRIVIDDVNVSLTAVAVAKIETGYWRELARRADIADSGPGLRVERLYNPASRASWAFLPALIGVTVMIAMVMLGSLSVARDRETGSWEGLIALPIRGGERLTGKLLPYVAIGTVQGLLVLAVAILLFDLPARGSIGALAALLPLFAAAHFVLGYAISTRAATQLAALQGAVAFYLPAMLLSGFLYPFETLPGWAQAIGDVFPLTHFIRAAQAVTLRGGGAEMVLSHGPPIAGFLAVGVGLALVARAPRLD